MNHVLQTTSRADYFSGLLGPHKVAALTSPFVLIGWLFLFAVVYVWGS